MLEITVERLKEMYQRLGVKPRRHGFFTYKFGDSSETPVAITHACPLSILYLDSNPCKVASMEVVMDWAGVEFGMCYASGFTWGVDTLGHLIEVKKAYHTPAADDFGRGVLKGLEVSARFHELFEEREALENVSAN